MDVSFSTVFYGTHSGEGSINFSWRLGFMQETVVQLKKINSMTIRVQNHTLFAYTMTSIEITT